MKAEETNDGFMSRWARRKAQARGGEPLAEPVPAALPVRAALPVQVPVLSADAALAPSEAGELVEQPPAEPLPTFADVAALTRDSDYSRFVGVGVDERVKQAAMKKLFADPHFNVMDGLDTYIDDYGKPDPIPIAMLRRMNQSKFLRLFEDEEEDEAKKLAEATNETMSEPDDHADLRLQQDDAARPPGPDQGAGA